jgi:methylmalonyl-CoA mutase, N-terminal domain
MDKKIYTDSGIEIEQFYKAPATEPFGENPGEFPFTRGIRSDMYRSGLWTMREHAGFGTAAENNIRYQHLINQGVSDLGISFDLPTQLGYDSDHALAKGEVGKAGVAIDSIRDMEELFAGISLEKISTSMSVSATGFILLAFYAVLAKQQGADLKKISGTVQNDILNEYAVHGAYVYPPKPSMRIITDLLDWCGKEIPRWNTISISGYDMREAGGTAVQELAFTLANGKAYVKSAISKGLDINLFGKRLSFCFSAHNDLFEEVAKFRAARRMWSHIMQELGATDPQAMMLRFHTQTSANTLNLQRPVDNVALVTIQSLAAVLGGTQSLYTNGFDVPMGLSAEECTEMAQRAQRIIGFESHVTDTTDPLGGSYFIESLTNSIEKAGRVLIRQIDEIGGSVDAIDRGYIQNEIEKSLYEHQRKVKTTEDIPAGVNAFDPDEKDLPKSIYTYDSIRKTQTEKLVRLRRERDPARCDHILQLLNDQAASDENLMPTVIQAVEAKCTLGEIADTLREVFGEHKT